MTANSFGIARCTVGCVVKEICTLISENIGPSFIVLPSEKNDVLNATISGVLFSISVKVVFSFLIFFLLFVSIGQRKNVVV